MCDFGVSEGITAVTEAVAESASAYGAAASVAATVASAAANAASQKRAADYQAQVADNNAKTAEANAQYALQVGDTKAGAKQEQTAQMLGAERAGLASSGVEIDSGSALRLQEDTSRLGKVDEDTIRSNAARDAYGFRTQGAGFAAAALQDKDAGNLDAFGATLTGASSVAGKWAAYKNNGTF